MTDNMEGIHIQAKAWGKGLCMLWGIVIALGFIGTQTLVYILYLSINNTTGTTDFSLLYNGNALAYAAISSTIVTIALIFLAIIIKKHSQFKDYLALQMASAKQHIIWISITIAIFISYAIVASYFNIPEPAFMQEIYQSADPKWLLWIAVVIAAPLSEEIFFRGFLLRSYLTSNVAKVLAVIITSAVWASIHLQYDWTLITLIFVLGLVLGTARIQSKSLILPIIIHALWNSSAMFEAARMYSNGL